MEQDDRCYRRFLEGESEAYDELMIRYGSSIVFYLNGYLHDLQESEDLMVEAFARVMVKRPKIRDGGVKAYLFKTAHNLALRHISRKSRMNCFYLEDLKEELPDSFRTEKQLLEEERKAALYRCLGRIDPTLREALWLIYMDDLSYKEAASVMGVSRKKVDNLLMKGKALLRNELEKEGITDAHE